MKALNHSEIEQLRKDYYPQFKSKAEFVDWLKEAGYVTVTSKGKKQSGKYYQVCTSVLK